MKESLEFWRRVGTGSPPEALKVRFMSPSPRNKRFGVQSLGFSGWLWAAHSRGVQGLWFMVYGFGFRT